MGEIIDNVILRCLNENLTIIYVCIKFLYIIILFIKMNNKIHYFNDKNTYNICLHLKLQNYFILLSKHFMQLKNCVYKNKLND